MRKSRTFYLLLGILLIALGLLAPWTSTDHYVEAAELANRWEIALVCLGVLLSLGIWCFLFIREMRSDESMTIRKSMLLAAIPIIPFIGIIVIDLLFTLKPKPAALSRLAYEILYSGIIL